MAYHFIAITSDYAQGQRIAWHYATEEKLDTKRIKSFLQKTKISFPNIAFGIHKLSTSSTSWESVVEKDSFFEDVCANADEDVFLKYLEADRDITAQDVAKIFLKLVPMSHLKLQKMIYLAYKDYLVKYGKKMFSEEIVAFKYGPVVSEVYQMYKKSGASEIELTDDDETPFKIKDTAIPAIFIKLTRADDGFSKFDSIARVLKKYGNRTAGELVDYTHSQDATWDKVYVEGQNHVLTDEVILKYHQNEKFVN